MTTGTMIPTSVEEHLLESIARSIGYCSVISMQTMTTEQKRYICLAFAVGIFTLIGNQLGFPEGTIDTKKLKKDLITAIEGWINRDKFDMPTFIAAVDAVQLSRASCLTQIQEGG